MGVLDLDIATVEWMRGASDEAVVVGVEMWLRAASACRLPCYVERFMLSCGRVRSRGRAARVVWEVRLR